MSENKERYVVMVYPKDQKEEIVYLGSPDSTTEKSVLIHGAWYVRAEMEAKGFTFHKPIAMTPELVEAMKVVVNLAEANDAMLRLIDPARTINNALDQIRKVLITHCGGWKR